MIDSLSKSKTGQVTKEWDYNHKVRKGKETILTCRVTSIDFRWLQNPFFILPIHMKPGNITKLFQCPNKITPHQTSNLHILVFARVTSACLGRLFDYIKPAETMVASPKKRLPVRLGNASPVVKTC